MKKNINQIITTNNMKKLFYLITIFLLLILNSCGNKNPNTDLDVFFDDSIYIKKSINDMKMVSEYGFDVSANTFDIFEFGSINNKKIKWFLIDKNETSALLLSKDVLELYKYYMSYTPTEWSKSDIRFYLNNEFFNKIFDDSEKEKILLNEDGDKLSILTIEQINKYFGFINNSFGNLYENEAIGAPNQKIISKLLYDNKKIGFNNEKHFNDLKNEGLVLDGLEFDEFFDYANNCVPFWLKDMGDSNYEAKIIDSLGYLSSIRVNSENIGIRPVLMVSLE